MERVKGIEPASRTNWATRARITCADASDPTSDGWSGPVTGMHWGFSRRTTGSRWPAQPAIERDRSEPLFPPRLVVPVPVLLESFHKSFHIDTNFWRKCFI